MDFNIQEPWKTLDPWQKEYIETKESCFLLCGRQVGKSTAASIKAARRAIETKNKRVLILATTERQAYALFYKVLTYIQSVNPKCIEQGKNKPTKHEIHLKNGSLITCLPTGLNGDGIRGLTITDLFIDEAARVPQEVFESITPMLSVTGGTMDVLSTPAGKTGFFYEASKRDDFVKFYVSSEDNPRISKEHLEREKEHLSRLIYAQEYLAQFLDDLKRVFSDELIKKCCVLKRRERLLASKYFMGCDIARFGGDENSFEIIDANNNEQVENITMKNAYLTDVKNKIEQLHELYNFRQIGIDDNGVGAGVYDMLLRDSKVQNKVIGLNNATRSLDRDDSKVARALKEDMYLNLLGLMESGKIKLLDDDELVASLASIQFEYIISPSKKTRFAIYGNYSHITEGLIRAFWLIKNKPLGLWAR
jgi:hypothetical protein